MIFRSTLLLCLIVATVMHAQHRPVGLITGQVMASETGEAVIGANVSVEGTTRGAATDIEGKAEEFGHYWGWDQR